MRRSPLPLGTVVAVALGLDLYRLRSLGLGFDYYAAAVKSMGGSWHNFWFTSFDPGGFVSVDKPPLALWLEVGSTKLFGFSGLSLLLPCVALGVASLVVLYRLVARWFGPAAGLSAAFAYAVTPVVVAVSRTNAIDILLVLLLLGAAAASLRAVASGSGWWLVGAGALGGLAFLTKFLAAAVALPAIVVVVLIFGPWPWRPRLLWLAGAVAAAVVVALPWLLAVDLTSPSARPYVGGSTDNHVVNLALGYNGFGRLAGGAGQGVIEEGGPPGTLRLFDDRVSPYVSWLLPVALVGAAVAWSARWAPALALLAAWTVTAALVLSLSRGLFHPYYVVLLAPPVAALAGVTAVRLTDDRRAWLPLVVVATAAIQWWILRRYPEPRPWLLAALGLGVVLSVGGRWSRPAAWLALASLLAAPATWSVLTVVRPVDGRLAVVGPAPSSPAAPSPRPEDQGPLIEYLESQRGTATFLVATASARLAAPLILASGQPVMALGGFTGSDPVMTQDDIAGLVRQGVVRHFLNEGLAGQTTPPAMTWVRQHCATVDPALWLPRRSATPLALYRCDPG